MRSDETTQAVKRMQDYIEQHLKEDITRSDLAAAAGYSQGHSERIFLQVMGVRPYEYMRKLRLAKAAEVLQTDGSVKILDVAFDFLFTTHEGFTRAFSKEFGVSPYRYKKNPVPRGPFMPAAPAQTNLNQECGGIEEMTKKEYVFTQITERPARKAVIKRGVKAEEYFAYCEEVGCDVWEVLEGIQEALYEPAGFWLPEKLIAKGTSKYVQGVEVPLDYSGPVPEGFELIEMEPCRVLVFQGLPYDEEKFGEAIGEIQAAIEKFDPAVYGLEWAYDDAPAFQLSPQGYRGYIEARPVRPLSR